MYNISNDKNKPDKRREVSTQTIFQDIAVKIGKIKSPGRSDEKQGFEA